MQCSTSIEFYGSLYAEHIRNGRVIDTRFCAPRTVPSIKNFLFSDSKFRRLFVGLTDRFGRLINREAGLVTSAGVTAMTGQLAAQAAFPIFYHDSGTGTTNNTNDPTHATISSISNATPQVVTTSANHGLTVHDIVQIAGVTTDTTANAIWDIGDLTFSVSTFSLQNLAAGGVAGVGSATWQVVNGARDTILATQAGPTTRATGTHTSSGSGTPASPTLYTSVGTVSYTSALAITEWGLFNQSAQGGTLWDRRWFNTAQAPQVSQSASGTGLTSAPINVQNGDSIQFTYNLTVNQGGS